MPIWAIIVLYALLAFAAVLTAYSSIRIIKVVRQKGGRLFFTVRRVGFIIILAVCGAITAVAVYMAFLGVVIFPALFVCVLGILYTASVTAVGAVSQDTLLIFATRFDIKQTRLALGKQERGCVQLFVECGEEAYGFNIPQEECEKIRGVLAPSAN